jgi:signal transduction histidine kinase
LRALAEEALRLHQGSADAAQVSLDLHGPGEAPIEGDRRLLARALAQLFENAIVASPPGATVRVEVMPRSAGGGRVIVSDEGVGMDPATAARALDGFRVSADGQTVEQGLGLPLARKLIEAHGGTLELRSEPGRGTSAVVLLP